MGLREKFPQYHRWIVFGTCYSLMVLFALSFQAVPPLLQFVQEEIPFSHSQAGYLMGAYTIPGLVIPPLIPWLAGRFNDRRLIVAALAMIVAGNLIFTIAPGYPMLLAGRLVAGTGGNVVMTLAPLIILTVFRRSVGKAVGFFNTAVPLGSMIALNLFAFTGPAFGWRMTAGALAVVAGLILCIHLLPLDLPGERPQEDEEEDVPEGLGRRIWLLVAIWLAVNVQTNGYNVFAPGFFQELGYSQEGSKGMTSIYILESVAVAPLAGWIVDRYGMKKLLLMVANALGAVSFFLLPVRSLHPEVWASLFGLGAAVVSVAVFALLAARVKRDQRSRGIAYLIVAANAGGLIGPAALGWILDIGGGFTWAFTFLALISLAMLFLVRMIPGRLTE
jgi:MFS family permease